MKKFCIWKKDSAQSEIVEGDSADVIKKPSGLLVKIKGKNPRTFKDAIAFTEVSEAIKIK